MAATSNFMAQNSHENSFENSLESRKDGLDSAYMLKTSRIFTKVSTPNEDLYTLDNMKDKFRRTIDNFNFKQVRC